MTGTETFEDCLLLRYNPCTLVIFVRKLQVSKFIDARIKSYQPSPNDHCNLFKFCLVSPK